MTTYFSDKVTCAHCKKDSEHNILGSTNTLGWPDLDLRPAEMKRSTMSSWLMLCPHCQYLASDISKVDGNMSLIGSESYINTLNQRDYPQLANWFLARSLLDLHDDPIRAGRYRLNAAWVCDDVPDDEHAVICRKLAAECFAIAKPFTNDESSVSNGTLLVDILRRSGDLQSAASTCAELLTLDHANETIQRVLKFEQQLIEKNDRAMHSLSECLEE